MTGAELGARLRGGDLDAAPAVLNLVESTTPEARTETAALLRAVSPAALGGEARAHVIGVTGPPGVGKSTLLSALIGVWRRQGRTVAALAVDPSSKRSGGALLGDRARIAFDPADRGVFVRSTATAHRLGGLARATRAGVQALAAAFDIVVVETVGVGQSETEVADLADTVVVVLQPGSGDALQFLKSGIMEIPDLLVVTKSDMGRVAWDTLRDARSAAAAAGSGETPTLAVSCVPPTEGVEAVADALDAHRARIDLPARRLRARRAGALADYVTEHGEEGLRRLGGRRTAERWLEGLPVELDLAGLVASLEGRGAGGRWGRRMPPIDRPPIDRAEGR
ncbi:MAG: ArgK protein [Actinobacteria bacterium]|nr:ArgK protein [Actinomycetota bacterium]